MLDKFLHVFKTSRLTRPRLGNIYLLLAMVGIAVLYTTTEAKVVRNYVIALWLADVGHVVITGYATPYEKLIDVANWNAITWGNIGATVGTFLLLNVPANFHFRFSCSQQELHTSLDSSAQTAFLRRHQRNFNDC